MIPAIALFLLSWTDPKVDFPWQEPQDAACLDAAPIIAIVTAEDNGAYSTRQELKAVQGTTALVPDETTWCRTGRVKVTLGKGARSGEVFRIVAPEPIIQGTMPLTPKPPVDRMPLRAGQRYLLFAYPQTQGKLEFPVVTDPSPKSRYKRRFDAESDIEVAAVMMFPTSESTIPNSPTADDVRLSIAKTLDPSDTESYRRASEFLHWSGPGRTFSKGEPFGATLPNATTRYLQSVLSESTPYQQSKVWSILISWRVPGAAKGFVRSLQSLAGDPTVYRKSDWDFIWPYNIRGQFFDQDALPNFKPDEYVDLVTNSRNDEITQFFLYNLSARLNQDQKRSLARLLLSPDADVREAAALRLAELNGDTNHLPTFTNYDIDEAVVKYWIDFYQVPH